MAKTSLIVKQKKLEKKYFAFKDGIGKKPKHLTKFYNRCGVCGRVRGYIREFGICRCCFKKYARLGLLVGVKKSSR